MPSIPNIFFNTSSVGITPLNPLVKNRIGIIGRFNRGLINTPSFTLGDTDVEQRYGLDDSPGALAYRTARQQGATDFGLVRVLGQEKQACSSVLLNGIASKDNILFLEVSNVEPIEKLEAINDNFFRLGFNYEKNDKHTYYIYIDNIELQSQGALADTVTFKVLVLEDTLENQDFDINLFDWNTITATSAVDASSGGTVSLEGIDLDHGSNLDSLTIGDIYYFNAAKYKFNIPINEGEVASIIVDTILSELSGIAPFGDVIRTKDNDGVIFCLDKEVAPGATGNSYTFAYDAATSDESLSVNGFELISENDNKYGNPLLRPFAGGVDGPRNAFRDFYSFDNEPLLRVIAASPGDWGNNLRITIQPTSVTNFRLTVVDTESTAVNNSETFDLDFKQTDEAGYLKQLENSRYIKGIFLPKADGLPNASLLEGKSPLRIEYPLDPDDVGTGQDSFGREATTNISLENGFEGPTISDADFIAAIDSFKNLPVHILLTDGYASEAVNLALISHAQNANELEGLRIALLAAPKFLNPSAAKRFVTGLSHKRAVGVAGWKTYSNAPNADRFSVPATADLAGILQVIPFYVSPAARGIIPAVGGVLEVDINKYSNYESLEIYGQSYLEILALDPSFLTYNFTTGYTLSPTEDFRSISTVRTFDFIRQDVYRLLTQFKSRPITAAMLNQVADSIDAYLETLQGTGQIAAYRPTVVDGSNNSQADFLSRRINIKICAKDLDSADFIYVDLIRDTSLSIGFIEA